MKKSTVLAAVVAVAATATMSYAGMNARTGVNGSFHDMNVVSGTTPDVYGRVCVFCHTPHNAVVTGVDGTERLPLWNKTVSVATYVPYQWATPDNLAAIGAIADPLVGPSRLCVTCHDGSIAVDTHGPATPEVGILKLTGNRAIGIGANLESTHPIGFKYSDAVKRNILADAALGTTAVDEIVPASERFASAVAINEAGYTTVTRNGQRTIGSTLFGGDIMTCATCHEVHNKENVINDLSTDGTTRPNYFLYAKEAGSAICLSCHVK
ncbi:MAG: cytochrome C [Desulfuromonadales bacterium]|nr:cytochrome C [Desulfuromonadales bacterium]